MNSFFIHSIEKQYSTVFYISLIEYRPEICLKKQPQNFNNSDNDKPDLTLPYFS